MTKFALTNTAFPTCTESIFIENIRFIMVDKVAKWSIIWSINMNDKKYIKALRNASALSKYIGTLAKANQSDGQREICQSLKLLLMCINL